MVVLPHGSDDGRIGAERVPSHDVQKCFGFGPLADPTRMMEILRPDIYQQPS